MAINQKLPPSPFDEHPEFYETDNRRFRDWNPITREVLEKKHRALLPEWMLEGKTVLDLGSCFGATGQWSLFYGAKSYTGVETQPEYAEASRKLLAHHGDKVRIIQDSIPEFLAKNTEKFDIVCLFGVLYVFVDYYRVLSAMAEASNEYVVIENLYPIHLPKNLFHIPSVEFIPNQRINLANAEASLLGFGNRMTPVALKFLMATMGFFAPEGTVEVEKITGSVDWYSPLPDLSPEQRHLQATYRYIMRFQKAGKKIEELGAKLASDRKGDVELWSSTGTPPKIESPGAWKFDDSIAKEFDSHARAHIPDYERVVSLCLKIAEKRFRKDAKILDIGSAIGFTLKRFSEAGFRNVFGVEASVAMIKESWKGNAKISLSDKFPKDEAPFDFVMANWTLHFIREGRIEYLRDVFEGLAPGGCLVLSEKILPNEVTLSLYHDFKRSNGVSDEAIRKKDEALRGVLVPYPLEWYLQTLREIGFSNVEIVNAVPCFVTLLAQKGD